MHLLCVGKVYIPVTSVQKKIQLVIDATNSSLQLSMLCNSKVVYLVIPQHGLDTSAWFTSIEHKTAFKLDMGAEETAISKITHQRQGDP